MSVIRIRKKKVFTAVIVVSLLLVIASIVVNTKERKMIDRIYIEEGEHSYSAHPNRPFLFYEVRVDQGDIINFMEVFLNDSLPIPDDWGVDVEVYDAEKEEVDGQRINNILIFRCSTRNMSFTAYQISYLLVEFTIEVEAYYYEANPIILYLFLSIVFIWINYLSYMLIKRRKDTEKWLKPFEK